MPLVRFIPHPYKPGGTSYFRQPDGPDTSGFMALRHRITAVLLLSSSI